MAARNGAIAFAHEPAAPPDEPEDSRALLTADETARFLRTTRKAIYAMAERGNLPGAVHVGRRLLVLREKLLSSLLEKCVPSPERVRR